jgi:hypothetical protein
MQPNFQCSSVLQKKIEENVCACSFITNVLHEHLLASRHTSLPMYCMNVLHHSAGIEPRCFLAGSVALSTGIRSGNEERSSMYSQQVRKC